MYVVTWSIHRSGVYEDVSLFWTAETALQHHALRPVPLTACSYSPCFRWVQLNHHVYPLTLLYRMYSLYSQWSQITHTQSFIYFIGINLQHGSCIFWYKKQKVFTSKKNRIYLMNIRWCLDTVNAFMALWILYSDLTCRHDFRGSMFQLIYNMYVNILYYIPV